MRKEYLVCVQEKHQQAEGMYYNLAKIMRGLGYSTYPSLGMAMRDLKKFVEQKNKGARTETTIVNGIGIDFVVDAESAQDFAVVDWYIKEREVSPWEIVAKM